MPFALIIIGLALVITGARNTHAALGNQLIADFTGPGNFTYWIVSIGAVGALGYYKPLTEFSRAFMLLIVLAMVIKNGGLFDKLTQAINMGPEASPAAPEPALSSATAAPSSSPKLPLPF